MLNQLRILIITGTKSFNEINSISEKITDNKTLNIKCHVKKAPVDVSAFITKHTIEMIWNEENDHNYDFILISGFIPWDSSDLTHRIGIPVYKGTRFSGNLYDLLLNVRNIQLSTKKAADSLIKNRNKNKIEDYIKKKIKEYETRKIDEKSSKILKFSNHTGIVRYVGSKFPPLLFAEIVNAPKLSDEVIIQKVSYYLESGADVIDIGTIVNEDNSGFLCHIIPKIKLKYNCFISIDSVDINEIIAGIESGADFILSIDGGNIDSFLNYCIKNNISKDLGLILIPLRSINHNQVNNSNDKINLLMKLAKKLTNQGFTNLMYDPLLKTPISTGITPSINDYYQLDQFLQSNKELKYPLFMGFNNIFELMDADSAGINALLSCIAIELNCGGILSTEFSTKSLGAIIETRRGIDLAYLAKISKSPPINLGYDAFFSKNKRKSIIRTENTNVIIDTIDLDNSKGLNEVIKTKLVSNERFIHDRTGYFKIYINQLEKIIEVLFFPSDEIKELISISKPILIKGKDAESIYKAFLKLNIVTELNHAFYLGKELSKAEYALHVNTSYFEDIEIE